MLAPFQLRWGIEQWVEFLKDKEIPVLPRTKAVLMALHDQDSTTLENISARELASYVYADPYLSLKLLRRAERRRTQRLGQETTTALAAVLQNGFDDLFNVVSSSSTSEDGYKGCNDCEFRMVMAASIAREWAMLRVDVSPDEVALAALLSESGELLLWHFAPELPMKVAEELSSGRAFRPIKAQTQAIGFSFKQLTLALVEAWQLPNIISLLIKGTDTPRANIARLAVDTARYIVANNRHPALPAEMVNIKSLLPGASYSKLIAPLPIPEDHKLQLLRSVEPTVTTHSLGLSSEAA